MDMFLIMYVCVEGGGESWEKLIKKKRRDVIWNIKTSPNFQPCRVN